VEEVLLTDPLAEISVLKTSIGNKYENPEGE
jgi:hypothetical protein